MTNKIEISYNTLAVLMQAAATDFDRQAVELDRHGMGDTARTLAELARKIIDAMEDGKSVVLTHGPAV